MKAILQIFSVILFWLSFSPSPGQGIYFNNTLDLGIHWASGMNVIANDSVYHIGGISGWAITIVEIDTTGNEVHWIKRYYKPGEESWYPGSQGNLYRVPAGGYCLGGTVVNQDTNIGLFVRFNSQFDTLFTRRFPDPVNYSLITTCAVPTFDGGFMLASELYMGGYHADILLLKTDSLGNELWRTSKSFGWWDRPWSIAQTPDSGFVIGGHTYRPGVYQSGDPLIAKFNKDGQFIWSQNPGGPYTDGKMMVTLNNDGATTALTTIGDSNAGLDFSLSRICVIKYSAEGDELWRYKYGQSIQSTSVHNIKSLPDGGYICCGNQPAPGNMEISHMGWLLRINAEGDSIWFRKYFYTDYSNPFITNSYRWNRLFDVTPTKDGGFIATGETYDDPPYGLQKIWVLKVDSLGCDTAGCDPTVGIEEAGEQGGLAAWGHGGVVVWPNPCSSVLTVSLTSRQSSALPAGRQVDSLQSVGQLAAKRSDVPTWSGSQLDRFKIELYDIFGRLVYEASTRMGGGLEGGSNGRGGGENGGQSWQINVSTLPPGIYIAVIRDERSLVGSAKFVVAR